MTAPAAGTAPGVDLDAQRFLDAQAGGGHERALAELRAGRKTSHWMWFVFPQVAGLGRSATAQHFALSGVVAAREYLAHPMLGPRLRECCAVLLELPSHDAEQLLGATDAVKLRSSMTLFDAAAPGEVFADVLGAYCSAAPDPATLVRLGG